MPSFQITGGFFHFFHIEGSSCGPDVTFQKGRDILVFREKIAVGFSVIALSYRKIGSDFPALYDPDIIRENLVQGENKAVTGNRGAGEECTFLSVGVNACIGAGYKIEGRFFIGHFVNRIFYDFL